MIYFSRQGVTYYLVLRLVRVFMADFEEEYVYPVAKRNHTFGRIFWCNYVVCLHSVARFYAFSVMQATSNMAKPNWLHTFRSKCIKLAATTIIFDHDGSVKGLFQVKGWIEFPHPYHPILLTISTGTACITSSTFADFIWKFPFTGSTISTRILRTVDFWKEKSMINQIIACFCAQLNHYADWHIMNWWLWLW